MSKELNIIEASNMPNTEFKVFYSDGSKRNSNIFTNSYGDMYNKLDNSSIDGLNEIINAKFIPIQKPVGFMDLVKNTQGKKVYVEFDTNCKQYSNVFIPKESNYFSKYLFNIINNNNDYDVRKIISEGKWFIEY